MNDINLENTYQGALERHREGVWRAGDMDLLAEAARRFVENEQANTAFHEGYKAGYQDGCATGPLGLEFMGRGFNGITDGKRWRRHVTDWEEVE